MTLQSMCRGVPFRKCSDNTCARWAWDGFAKCPRCRFWVRRWQRQNLAYDAAKKRELVAKRATLGLCRKCGKRPALRYRCEECKGHKLIQAYKKELHLV